MFVGEAELRVQKIFILVHRNKSSHAVHTLIGSHTTDASETGGPVGLFADPMQRRPL
jgi:hypothetical protein